MQWMTQNHLQMFNFFQSGSRVYMLIRDFKPELNFKKRGETVWGGIYTSYH